MNVSRDDQGEIKLDCEDHSISFSFNRRQITPESDEEKKKYQMISDVMSTPKNKPSTTMDEMDWKNYLKKCFRMISVQTF